MKHLISKISIKFLLSLLIIIKLSIDNSTSFANDLYPPYARDKGRKGCLDKSRPGDWDVWYNHHCAEATGESNGYEPKIKVRKQTCTLAGCWTDQKSLGWDGQCVMWASNLGFPPLRYCARVAVKDDPGYTVNKYLDSKGDTQNDPVYTAEDGTTFNLELPKLCAYQDPSGLETLIDIVDIDPLHAPFHKTDQVHPLADMIITALANSVPMSAVVRQFLQVTEADSLGEDFVDAMTFILGGWFETGFTTLLDAIKKELKMNRIVNDNLGCVNIPLRSGPECFCPFLTKPTVKSNIQEICRTLNDGTIEKSTMASPCVVAKDNMVVNNLIKNSIRVGYNQYLPICEDDVDPSTTTACVKISFGATGSLTAPSIVHTGTNKKDIIPKCDASLSQQPCVQTKLAKTEYRVAYGVKSGTFTQRLESFAEDTGLSDCVSASSTNAMCQRIIGVNAGDFQDVQLNFLDTEPTYTTSELSSNFTVLDAYNNAKQFQATIVREQTEITTVGITQQPNQICVFEGTSKAKLIGCKTRTDSLPKPSVYACDSPQSKFSCSPDYFKPKIVVELKSGTDSTQGVVEVENIYSPTVQNNVNLAGFDYSTFVTDGNYTKIPFDVPPAVDPKTIYGNYTPTGINPLDNNCARNNTLSYLSGLEYCNGKYSLGGKKICLSGFSVESCNDNKNNCVLTSLANNNIVSCKSFVNNYFPKYPGLRKCSATDNSTYPVIDSMPNKSGGAAISIRECNGSVKYYCYDHTDDLCTPTFKPSDRVQPAYSGAGTEVLADTDYFEIQKTCSTPSDPNTCSYNYDQDLQTVRDKTEIEHGLCGEVPQLKCTAIDDIAGNNAANGFAKWIETEVGEEADGSCITGYGQSSSQPVQRDCLIDFSSGTPQAKFGPLKNGYICQAGLVGLEVVQDPTLTYNTTSKSFVMGTIQDTTVGGLPAIRHIITVYGTGDQASTAGAVFETQITVKIPDKSKLVSFNWIKLQSYVSAIFLSTNGNPHQYSNCNDDSCVNAALFNVQTNLDQGGAVDLMPYLVNGDNTLRVFANQGRAVIPFMQAKEGTVKVRYEYVMYK
jgi:hypothetical protein